MLFNTGVDSGGTPLANSAASIDPHYTITTNPDAPPADGVTRVHDDTLFPLVSGPSLANTTTAKWIAPRFDTANSAAGTYEYTTTFTLPTGSDLMTATISGVWAFDNAAGTGGIFLNGTSVAGSNGGFSSLTSFTIPMNTTAFVIGLNTLAFQGTNISGPTGLFVDELSGTVVPEPSAALLLGGMGVLSLLRRRKS